MKIVCTSDTHGMHDQIAELPAGDVFIRAGDFSDSYDEHYIGCFNEWLGTLPYRHKIVIAGNHDGACVQDIEQAQAEFTNAIFLHNSGCFIDGVRFWGSPIHPQIANFPFGLPRNSIAMRRHWTHIPLNTDVLITHGPPHGIGDRTAFRNEQVGCEVLREWVDHIAPRLHVFGHIHEGYGMYERAATTFINASAVTVDYEIRSNPFVVFDLE